MKKILVIDIGNTNIVCGIYTEGELQRVWRLSSDSKKTSDEYFSILYTLAEQSNMKLEAIDHVVLSSVVPSLSRCFEHLFQRYFKSPVIVVTGYTPLGLSFSVSDPGFIGADLIVNAYSAWKKYEDNCIICDMGTATTIQLVDKSGHFHGTSIIPGVVTGAFNLFEKAALLSNIQLEKAEHLLGTTTKDALLSGIVLGHAYMIDRFIMEIKKKWAHLIKFKTIATGGIASLICDHSNEIDIIDKTLTLDGLYKISQIKE